MAVNGTTGLDKENGSQSLWLFIGISLLCLLLWNTPGVSLLLKPIGIFVTALHELSHAIATVATGGQVTGLTIVSDGKGHGGLTMSSGGLQFIVAQAGYLGTALWGCLFIYLSRFKSIAKAILLLMGLLIIGASLFFMSGTIFQHFRLIEGVLSLGWGVAIGAGLIWCGLKLKPGVAQLVLIFLAIQTALNAVTDVFYVIQASTFGWAMGAAWSDATNMAQLTHIPAIFWSLLWGVISVVMLCLTGWWTYGSDLKSGKVKL